MGLALDIILLVLGLGIILAGAELFTNAVEWLGKRLGLNQGAIGSVLAAVGTAMPETLVPIIALVFGGGASSHDIGIGAILGAPFMLSTLAFFITGLAIVIFSRNGRRPRKVTADAAVMRRDLGFFILVYVVVVLAGVFHVSGAAKYVLSVVLFGFYGLYLWQTFTHEEEGGEDTELAPLFFSRRPKDGTPSVLIIVLQLAVALAAIVAGAKSFVNGVSLVSNLLGVPAFVLAVIIAPIATELPEKFNSVIWVGQNKDTLALGNITGAMVFQSSVIPAIGMLLTPWVLQGLELATTIIALASATVAYLQVRQKGAISPWGLLLGGVFYAAFIVAVVILH